jgi:NAD(P)-dependent dehydrogenase (short-subunit alcohol dehydrogenase family)
MMTVQGMNFSGKTAIVTGGASGIGAATVRRFAAAGAWVAILDRDAPLAAKLAGELGERVAAFDVDVARPEAVEDALQRAASRFGRIDAAISCAGVRSACSIAGMSYAEWQRVMDINLSPSFYLIKAAAPYMKAAGGGSVVLIASTAAKHLSLHGGANYTTAKAGMLGLARQAAFELAPDRIRVNVVCPGPVQTAMSAKSTWPVEKMIPLGERIQADDVAASVLFLCSEDARMCTGTTLDVDGGFLLANGVDHATYFSKRDHA